MAKCLQPNVVLSLRTELNAAFTGSAITKHVAIMHYHVLISTNQQLRQANTWSKGFDLVY